MKKLLVLGAVLGLMVSGCSAPTPAVEKVAEVAVEISAVEEEKWDWCPEINDYVPQKDEEQEERLLQKEKERRDAEKEAERNSLLEAITEFEKATEEAKLKERVKMVCGHEVVEHHRIFFVFKNGELLYYTEASHIEEGVLYDEGHTPIKLGMSNNH